VFGRHFPGLFFHAMTSLFVERGCNVSVGSFKWQCLLSL
jgi:hypothetical protein